MFTTIRAYTEQDIKRVDAAAKRFCSNHGIEAEDLDFKKSIEIEIYHNLDGDERSYLEKLWYRAFCRALKTPYNRKTVIYAGHVGIWSKA